MNIFRFHLLNEGMRYLFLLLLVVLLYLPAAGRSYYFRNYRNDDGLSNNTVMACIQDRRGFVWFGTREGLTRFDGYQFKVFLHDPAVPNSLIHNFVTALCEDNDGWIWTGTSNGLCYYIPESDFFGTIGYGNQGPGLFIQDLIADKDGNIWIVTYSGILRYAKADGSTKIFPSGQYFVPLSVDMSSNGDVWFCATDGKIYRYDSRNDAFTGIRVLDNEELSSSALLLNILDQGNGRMIVATSTAGLKLVETGSGRVSGLPDESRQFSDLLIRTASMYNSDEIWIGTETGIHIYSLDRGFVTNLRKINTDPYSLSNNAIRSITRDREGGVWIGTFYGGVSYLPGDYKSFDKFYPTGLPGSLNGNVVREMRADAKGNIWIGTEDAGLFRFDPESGRFSDFFSGTQHDNIASRNIQGLHVSGDSLWIATNDKGIFIMDIPSERIIRHFDAGDRESGLRTNTFITMLGTSRGEIYAGGVSGLYMYNRRNSSWDFLENVAAFNFIHDLYEDVHGDIWIGTYGNGLFRYERSAGTCIRITSGNEPGENPVGGHITSLFEDGDHRIWVMTEGRGLSYIDGSTGLPVRYDKDRDFGSTIFCAMLQDSSGELWISSTQGLIRLDPVTGKFRKYSREDGIPDNNFSYNSAFMDSKGKMYFGSISGLVSFYPSDIKENTYNPPVYFTGFQVNGEEYGINRNGSPGFRSVLVNDRIRLSHNQSSLSIDFVSPSFTSPSLIRYKYRMEGSDQDWVFLKGNRKVYYTNLQPGEYRLRVQSSPDGENWSPEESVLNIDISPPFWLSLPAYIFYLAAIISLVYTILSFYLKKKSLEQQRKIDFLEANKEKEILNAKINFFTNITHEVRTPLTLIKGPLDRILKSGVRYPKDTEENLLIIRRNADRLMSLTNQLLDFRKTEKEMFRLSFVRTDLSDLVGSTFNLFLPYSNEKRITMHFDRPSHQFIMPVDREALTKILSNLLSNALKFAESKVDVSMEYGNENNDTVRIVVKSDGRRIPEEFSEKIFEPFYQIDFDKPGEKGTGLGLSLARSLADLHHGRLYLDISDKTCNSFVLELQKVAEDEDPGESVTDTGLTGEYHDFEIFNTSGEQRPLILLVEDEIEMGRFIGKEISSEYNVVLAHNGEEALKALKKYNFTMVVSDVIMPALNGYELCRRIRSDVEFSHIPVILLTATIHLNARIEGLDSGADAYIEKPFTTDLLMAQIANLIKNRNLERQNYLNSPLVHFKSVAMNKTDEEFLKKLNSTMMDNFSKTDLSVEMIAGMMGVSVSTLYRKVKALTDLNTVEFIRLARLKKAAELLSEGDFRISEVSYLVGFSSPSYFSTSFQKQFGISPSQFVRNMNKTP